METRAGAKEAEEDMKGSGPRNERETIVRFDDESDTAEIWTASDSIYRRLKKAKFELIEDGERHAIFKCLKSEVKFRKYRKSTRKSNPAGLLKWHEERRKVAG